jgi:hypothetical protein
MMDMTVQQILLHELELMVVELFLILLIYQWFVEFYMILHEDENHERYPLNNYMNQSMIDPLYLNKTIYINSFFFFLRNLSLPAVGHLAFIIVVPG